MLGLLYRATTHARNISLDPATPLKKIEVLMDAINHIPEMLSNWERFDEVTFFIHLATYDEKWGGPDSGFNLKQTYLDICNFGPY